MIFDFENAEGLPPSLKSIPPEDVVRMVNARARIRNTYAVQAMFHKHARNWWSADIILGGVDELSKMSGKDLIVACKVVASEFERELALYLVCDDEPLKYEP